MERRSPRPGFAGSGSLLDCASAAEYLRVTAAGPPAARWLCEPLDDGSNAGGSAGLAEPPGLLAASELVSERLEFSPTSHERGEFFDADL